MKMCLTIILRKAYIWPRLRLRIHAVVSEARHLALCSHPLGALRNEPHNPRLQKPLEELAKRSSQIGGVMVGRLCRQHPPNAQ